MEITMTRGGKMNHRRVVLITLLSVLTGWIDAEITLREDFLESPAHIPIAQQDLNQGHFLKLERIGDSAEKLKLSHHPERGNDPHYLWNGITDSPTAALFHFSSPLDLSAEASRIRVRTKNVGRSTMHLAIKRKDNSWLVAEKPVASTLDWTISEHRLEAQTWRGFDGAAIALGAEIHPRSFDEIAGLGFVFPENPRGSQDCVRLDWFEIVSPSMVVPDPTGIDYGDFIEPSLPVFRSGFVFEDKGVLNRTRRGAIFRIAENKWAAFDPDLLRYVAVWETPESIPPISMDSMPAISYPDAKAKARTAPWLQGKIIYKWPEQPGITRESFDPRENKIGPLPPAIGRWIGLEDVDTHRPTLVYQIGERKVREQCFWVNSSFVRKIEVSPGDSDIWINTHGQKGDQSPIIIDFPASDKPTRKTVSIEAGNTTISASSKSSKTFVKKALYAGTETIDSPIPTDKSKNFLGIRYINHPKNNHWHRAIRPVDLAFRENGDCYIVGFDGDIWKVTDIESVSATWRRVASGIYEPMAIETGLNDELFVLGRDQITELVDTDGDGIFDQHLCRSDQFIQSLQTRDYSTSLAVQADGSFLLAKGGIYHQKDLDSDVGQLDRHRGTVLKISSDGLQVETLAEGLRMPFVGLSSSGQPLVSDQQGQWVPSTPIHRLPADSSLVNLGYAPTNHSNKSVSPPAIWLPHDANRSAAGFLPFTNQAFPSIVNSTAHFSWGGSLLVIPDQDDNSDDFVWGFSDHFDIPLLNGDLHPKTGRIYAIGLGISGYVPTTKRMLGIAEIWQNKQIVYPTNIVSKTNEIELKFHSPLPKKLPHLYGGNIRAYNVVRTQKYGSGHYRYDETPGEDIIRIDKITSSSDRKTLRLHLGSHLSDYSIVRFRLVFADDSINIFTTTRGLPELTTDQLAAMNKQRRTVENDVVGDAEKGSEIFKKLGCSTCHSVTGEKLNGPSLTAKTYDPGYLEESILYPSKQVVEGYLPNMPPYLGVVSKQQLADLITYIQSISR